MTANAQILSAREPTRRRRTRHASPPAHNSTECRHTPLVATEDGVWTIPGNLPLSRYRLVATDGRLAYRQNRVRHSTAGGHMFEGVDHFSFRDDLLLRDRPHDRAGPVEMSRPAAEVDVEWTFRTRQAPRKQVGVTPVQRSSITVKKVWAATSVHSHQRRSGIDSRPSDRRPSRLSLSFPAQG
jgi:hypothetical protein